MGKGTTISVINDLWIPDEKKVKLASSFINLNDFKVAELIDSSSKTWKNELIESTFPEEVAEKILRIPLAEEPHEDF